MSFLREMFKGVESMRDDKWREKLKGIVDKSGFGLIPLDKLETHFDKSGSMMFYIERHLRAYLQTELEEINKPTVSRDVAIALGLPKPEYLTYYRLSLCTFGEPADGSTEGIVFQRRFSTLKEAWEFLRSI